MEVHFPMMKFEEIAGFLGDFGIQFTLEDLINPHSMRMVFDHFADLFFGANRTFKQQQQPTFNNLVTPDLGELHEEAIPEITVLSSIMKIGAAAMIPNFSVRDITNPEKKRSITILSGLANFSMFRDGLLPSIHQVMTSTDEIRTKKAEGAIEVSKLKEQLNALEFKRRQEQPIIQSLDDQLSAATTEMVRLNEEQLAAFSVANDEKAKLIQMTQHLTNVRFKINGARQEIAKLRATLVADPDALKRLVDEKRAQMESIRASIAQEEKREAELSASQATLSRVEKELQKGYKLLEDCHTADTRRKETKRGNKAASDHLHQRQATLTEREEEKQHLQRQLQISQDKRNRFTQTIAREKNSHEQSIAVFVQERSALERQRVDTVALLDRHCLEKQQIQSQMDQEKKQHDLYLESIAVKMSEFESTFKEYYGGIRRAVKQGLEGCNGIREEEMNTRPEALSNSLNIKMAPAKATNLPIKTAAPPPIVPSTTNVAPATPTNAIQNQSRSNIYMKRMQETVEGVLSAASKCLPAAGPPPPPTANQSPKTHEELLKEFAQKYENFEAFCDELYSTLEHSKNMLRLAKLSPTTAEAKIGTAEHIGSLKSELDETKEMKKLLRLFTQEETTESLDDPMKEE
ncbi:kinetochore protein nuf2 [Planoprotostelium fungivorum]|uniref:Kinetochore protein nuf2 n=1 Tax=Planoprotostelium fungivorum TaxID=1890364 RepID=A0A2P6NHH7_9EUKA|nr:kinetochore protein nuf2 [Planoprotostelium fungivorum]